jgi:hypothetical protein
MIYRCKKCNFEEKRGFLPGVSCGLLFLALIGLWVFAFAIIVPVVHHIYRRSLPQTLQVFLAHDWLVMLAAFPVSVVGAIALYALLEAVEWLVFARRRCANCGARHWSWGFTRGFGL